MTVCICGTCGIDLVKSEGGRYSHALLEVVDGGLSVECLDTCHRLQIADDGIVDRHFAVQVCRA